MNSRTIVAAISISLFTKEFLSLNKLPFDYHYHDGDELVDYRKGTYLISFKYFQHVLNRYENPRTGDLVLVEQPDKTVKFKIVDAAPQSYYSQSEKGIYYYVPNGFVVLKDPQTQEVKMQFLGNVRGCDHFPLSL